VPENHVLAIKFHDYIFICENLDLKNLKLFDRNHYVSLITQNVFLVEEVVLVVFVVLVVLVVVVEPSLVAFKKNKSCEVIFKLKIFY